MLLKKSYEINEALANEIISVAYGDSSLHIKFKIYRLSKNNPDVKKLLENYRAVAKEVHNLKEEDFPEELLKRVKQKTIGQDIKSNSFAADLYTLLFIRPLVSATVLAVLIGTIVFGIIMNRAIEYRYTPEQVELADKQGKEALGIVGKIFNQTSVTLKEDVLNSRVAKPIRESMGIVNEFFTIDNKINKGEIQ